MSFNWVTAPFWRLRPGSRVLLLALLLGVANALLLLGPGPINPTNTSWIFGDNGTYYSAWEQYRHDPHLHFPLAWTERVGYPVGTSIALLDAIPIVAVVLRPLSPILPEPFQYLGLWATLCFVLQAYFGYSLCKRLFPRDTLFCVLGSAFFLLSAPLTDRAAGHTTLLSQWLILAALDSYFRDPERAPVRWLARFWIVVAIAGGVTPYIAAMCFLLALGAVARLRIENRCGWIQTIVLAAATGVVLFASLTTFGVLFGSDAKMYWAAGYGIFSMNLNAVVNPMSKGSILLPPLRLAFAQQYEGYSYLGLGTIALLAIGLVRRPGAFAWLADRRLLPLALVAIICTGIAASAVVTFGHSVLFTVPLPKLAIRALGGLRASGRLFWPAYYLIYLAALSLTFWLWKAPARVAILAVALGVQFADMMPLRAKIRTICNNRFQNPTQAAAWRGLGRTYDNLILVPSFQCALSNAPGNAYSFVYFGKLAATEQMRLNSYYAARYSGAELQAHCVDLLRTQLEGTLDPRSAYVVTDPVRTIWELEGVRSHTCWQADGFNLCTTPETSAAPSTPTPAPPAAVPYTLNETLDFAYADGNARKYLTFGWGDAVAGGTWTDGPLAMLRLGLSASADRSRPLVLDVDATPFLAEAHRELDVDVVVNGAPIAQWSYRLGAAPTPQQADIPAEVAARRPGLDLEFRFRNPAAPLYVGAGPSSQFLGLNVHSLVIRTPQSPVVK